MLDDFELNIKGYVFDKNELVFKGKPFPRTLKNIKELGNISKYNVYMMKEGTCIRVFYHNNKWHVTTTRKLSAFKSKWGSNESFGELFEKMILEKSGLKLEEFLDSLNKNLKYSFGTSKFTRIVCPKHSDMLNYFMLWIKIMKLFIAKN